MVFMKKYFYTDGTNQFGPFTFEELKGKQITKETKVWFEGIQDWSPAGSVEELFGLCDIIPPPLHSDTREFSFIMIKNKNNGITEKVTLSRWNEVKKAYGESNFEILGYYDDQGNKIMEDAILKEKPKPPKTYLTESILVTVFCCLPFGVIGIVNASMVESKYYSGDVEGAMRASQEAKKWTDIGFWVGLIGGIIYVIFLMIGSLGRL